MTDIAQHPNAKLPLKSRAGSHKKMTLTHAQTAAAQKVNGVHLHLELLSVLID